MKKMWKLVALTSAAALIASACGGDDGGGSSNTTGGEGGSDIKVAVIYIGSAEDKGWTYQHEQGILELESELGIEVKRVDNVPEGPESEEVMGQLVRDGYDLVFATSFGYGLPMNKVALANPDACFQWATGAKFLIEEDGQAIAPNLGTYFGSAEEARYLSGMAAGSASPTGKLGYVAAFPIPEVIRGINAFALGAQSINPDATVQVVWTETWFDPAKEKEAAESLLAAGADVLAQHQDSTATGEAAKEAGAKWVGYNSDVAAADFPDTWLTSPVWNWGPHYVKLATDVANGTCDNSPYYGNMADGMITLGVFGSSVDQETQDLIAEAAQGIIDGTLVPFTGPIKDNEGNEQIAAGATASLGDLLGQSYLVEGVIGSAKG